MTKTIDYYFTVNSPWTYLGHARFVAIAQRAGAHVAVKPVDMARVFAVSGGVLGRAVWEEERDISDPETLKAIATENGRNAGLLWEAAQAPATREAYDAYTQEAIDRQVFGAPTYAYRDELFWGQDRLDFLERALAR